MPQGGKQPSAAVRASEKSARGVKQFALNQYHKKMSEIEQENVGVKAVHKAEETAENLNRGGKSARSAYRLVKDAPYRRVAKLEKKAVKTNVRLDYRKALQENPKLKSNLLSRMMQKQKIKRDYAKAARQAKKTAGKTAKKTGETLAGAAKALFQAIKSHPGIAVTIGALAMVIVMLTTTVSSCSNMAAGGLGTAMGTSYLAPDTEINSVELAYSEWETDLQIQVNSAETTYPGFDEYRYNVGDIGHNPYELMAFATAKYQNFTAAAVLPELEQIFSQQYQLSFIPETETRYNDPEDENQDGDLEPYEWHILNVNLTSISFTGLAASGLSSTQQDIYGLLMYSKGNRQYMDSPFAFNWLPYVSCYYGWRVHPITGLKDNHTAVDIAVAAGTSILATHNGTVTTAAADSSYGNYIVLDDGKGLVTKYAHCASLLVSAGQVVSKGDPIATVGNTGDSTGPHLHYEVIKDGQSLNPLYFAVTKDDGTGNLPPGSPGGPEYPAYPGTPLGDGSYAALIAEAELHLGKRYVFGASGPANFDCSSFVCWVLDKSGVRPTGRTTAQGLYNMSTPVSPANAMPGDLIFYSGYV